MAIPISEIFRNIKFINLLLSMKNKSIDKKEVVEVELQGMAKLLQPIVFKDGDSYCCLFGSDPQAGIFGCGDTAIDAVEDWNKNLQDHLTSADENDELVKFVKGISLGKLK